MNHQRGSHLLTGAPSLEEFEALATDHLSKGDFTQPPPLFEYAASSLTNIEMIDQHHQMFVTRINELSRMLASPDRYDADAYHRTVSALIRGSREHFEAEQRLMSEFGVDARHQQAHLTAHENFFLAIPRDPATSTCVTGLYLTLLDHLITWLATHILLVDQCMLRQIEGIKNGLSPQAAHDREYDLFTPDFKPLLGVITTLIHRLGYSNHIQQPEQSQLEEAVRLRTRELEACNQRLRRLSTQDDLTGLPNRRFATMALKRLHAEHLRLGENYALILLDADGFKNVNDTFGHHIGDEALKSIAERLGKTVRNSDIVCRLGGDEFLVICPHTSEEGAIEVGRKIIGTRSPFIVERSGMCWDGAVSIGISAFRPDAPLHYRDLLIQADAALYRSKQNGKGILNIFHPMGPEKF